MLVARMVIAATLVMLIGMVFRLPSTYQGAIYALVVSRESSQATFKSAVSILSLTAIGGVYLLASVWFVISIPTLHFLWVLASFFLVFYAISTVTNFGASTTFAIMICIGVPLWDRHLSAETNVEDTLWLCLSSAIGVTVTMLVEILFSRIKPGEDIIAGVAERLTAVQNLLAQRAENRPVDQATETDLARLSMVGTSMLRRILARSAYSLQYAEQLGAVIALAGRLVDITANLALQTVQLSNDDRWRIRRLAENIAGIRSDLLASRVPELRQPFVETNSLAAMPFLPELEKTVALIPEACADSQILSAYAPVHGGDPAWTFLVQDAFTNAEHIKFALKGCLAAGLCYSIYNAVDWAGISTAVTTCFLTALSTVGASRQKQVLRITGAAVGGFVFGMGSQIFILPDLDSIAGFTILFIFVTVFSSWFMTSSPRLSYFGLQIAVAFYLIHLDSFAIEPSLSIARDRVVGILFGLVMMWLVFDQLWGAPAVVEMKKAFISSLRLLAQFAREPISADYKLADEHCYSLREAINSNFGAVRASADGVLFEFGPFRQQGLAWRHRIRELQPQLRLLFLTEIALWKHRARLPGFELPETVRAAQQRFDEELAKKLDAMADRMEGKTPTQTEAWVNLLAPLKRAIREARSEDVETAYSAPLENFLRLCRTIGNLTNSLEEETRDAPMQLRDETAPEAHA